MSESRGNGMSVTALTGALASASRSAATGPWVVAGSFALGLGLGFVAAARLGALPWLPVLLNGATPPQPPQQAAPVKEAEADNSDQKEST